MAWHQKRVALCLMSFFVIVVSGKANASQMTTGYPKVFSLTGIAELQYRDDIQEASSKGIKFRDETVILEQRYTLGVAGYIYHPRLAVFSTEVSFDDVSTLKGSNQDSKGLGYSFYVAILPYRPISFYIFASNRNSNYNVSNSATQDTSTSQYGAKLNVNTKILPIMSLEYYHSAYDAFSSRSTTDLLSYHVRGDLKPLRTRYQLYFNLFDFSSPGLKYNSKLIGLYTDTQLRNGPALSTSFAYSDQTFAKQLNFDASLQFRPGARFYHSYSYEYIYSKLTIAGNDAGGIAAQTTTNKDQVLRGSLGYNFTNRLHGSLSLTYALHSSDLESSTASGVVPSLDYRKSFIGMEFSSHYAYYWRQNTLTGTLKEHDIELGLTTYKLRGATIYSNYVLIISDETMIPIAQIGSGGPAEDNTTVKTITHLIRVGMRGKGMGLGSGRSYWNIEGEYLNSASDGIRPVGIPDPDDIGSVLFVNQPFSKKTSQYIFFGDILFPFGKGATIHPKAGYSFGTTDSSKTSKLFYDVRLTYPVSRKLALSLWWEQIWNKIEEGLVTKTRDYQLLVNYSLGKTFLNVTYEVLRTDVADASTQNTRFYVTLRRYL